MSFDTLGLSAELLRAVGEQGYTIPTPIQAKAIPVILDGRDVMASAQTGTGKTAGFTLPLLQRLNGTPHNGGRRAPRALVLAPTRELAAQVGDSVATYGGHLPLKSTIVFGGVGFAPQAKALRRGVDILIATPGRLLDHVSQKTVDLSQIEILVLDEADRMLDMGFINDIDAILRKTPMSRQTMLFSATFPDAIKNLVDRYMMHPEMVRMHTGTKVKASVEHLFYPVAQDQKVQLMIEVLRREKPGKALIFSSTREGTSE
ncbi:MAG: DEAD/DEAH box helicase, partial [Gammaproteobacteria bacterium]|nr:DEAD/DEAH box helicase [Gammaproteobacteria bacterium]